MTDLEGRSLDEALAREVPWKRPDGQQWLSADVPEWHTSLDALLRDIEPVCRERGMTGGGLEWDSDGYFAYALHDEDSLLTTAQYYGPTAATALARAFLAVLTRGER